MNLLLYGLLAMTVYVLGKVVVYCLHQKEREDALKKKALLEKKKAEAEVMSSPKMTAELNKDDPRIMAMMLKAMIHENRNKKN